MYQLSCFKSFFDVCVRNITITLEISLVLPFYDVEGLHFESQPFLNGFLIFKELFSYRQRHIQND